MKKYKVIDITGQCFMDYTHKKPITLNELRKRFWNLNVLRTKKYSDFTANYIETIFEVEFKEFIKK